MNTCRLKSSNIMMSPCIKNSTANILKTIICHPTSTISPYKLWNGTWNITD